METGQDRKQYVVAFAIRVDENLMREIAMLRAETNAMLGIADGS
tara:strand:- start:117 stop:248 length:132 start_codon:yes stop_codon:yes gene_type:complete